MSIAEERDTIGCEFEDLVHGVRETVRRLIGQAIDEVDVNAVKTEIARGEKQVTSHFERLNAVDGFLHVRVKILNTHAKAIEAEFSRVSNAHARSDARINLRCRFPRPVRNGNAPS